MTISSSHHSQYSILFHCSSLSFLHFRRMFWTFQSVPRFPTLLGMLWCSSTALGSKMSLSNNQGWLLLQTDVRISAIMDFKQRPTYQDSFYKLQNYGKAAITSNENLKFCHITYRLPWWIHVMCKSLYTRLSMEAGEGKREKGGVGAAQRENRRPENKKRRC